METRIERYNKKQLKKKLIISTISVGLIAIMTILIGSKFVIM